MNARNCPSPCTSGESQVTLAGALCLCPVKEGEENYREEKVDGKKTGLGRQEQKVKDDVEMRCNRSEWSGYTY